jgi:hypothetical protein
MYAMLLQQKTGAFLAHLLISCLAVGAVLGLVFLVWYPHPYSQALDTWEVVRVLVGVDLILGPALTFIVYRPGKPRLALDLAVIATVQMGALLYGASVLQNERPHYMVFSGDRFALLSRLDADFSQIRDPEVAADRSLGPRLVVAPLPEEPMVRAKMLADMMDGKQVSLHFEPAYWKPYAAGTASVIAAARPLQALAGMSDDAAAKLEQILARYEDGDDALGFLPLAGRGRYRAVLVDRRSGTPVEVVDIDPTVTVAHASTGPDRG